MSTGADSFARSYGDNVSGESRPLSKKINPCLLEQRVEATILAMSLGVSQVIISLVIQYFRTQQTYCPKSSCSLQDYKPGFEFQRDYLHQDELYGWEGRPTGNTANGAKQQKHFGPQWGLLKFSQPVTAPKANLHSRLFISTPLEDATSCTRL